MSITRSIAQNTVIQIVGKAAGIFFSLLTIGLITRHLGQSGFGYYTTVFAFLQVFGILVDFGLQTTTVSLISDPKHDESKMMSNLLTLRLVSSLIFLGLAPLIALLFPYPQEVRTGIAIAALFFVFVSLTSVLTGLFQKHLAMKYTVIADFISRVLLFVLVAASIYYNFGLTAIIIVTVVSSIIHYIILRLFTNKFIRLKFSFDFNTYKKIFLKTYPIAITIALNLVYFKSDILILSVFRSPEEVGLYGAPYKVLEVLINLVYLFLGLLLPIMATSAAAKNQAGLKKITQAGFNVISIFSIPMIFGTLILGQPIMTLVAGQDFAVSGDLLKILILATAAIFFASLFGYVIIAMNKQKQMIRYYCINAIVSLVLYFALIPPFGYFAAAWLTLFTEVFILVTAIWVMKKYLDFTPQLTVFSKSLLASIIMAVVLYILPSFHVVAAIVLACVIYFTALYLLGGITKQNIIEIARLK